MDQRRNHRAGMVRGSVPSRLSGGQEGGGASGLKPFDFRKQVMNHYRMKDLDTLTITEKGQAQFPASWRKQAGLMRGGPCDVRVLDDGRQSLLITPRPQKRRGAVGLLAHLEDQAVAFPKVERHTMPFK
jgi:bifunctional DNA-binding transcriptional regulator/antitoxin component of YhaV-PrlF toxin-antitoxin module